MGFLDALLGRRKVAQPASRDRLFAMSTAAISLEADGVASRGRAAIVFQSLGTADFSRVVQEMEDVLRSTGEDTGTTVRAEDDTFGYRWMILEDPDVEDLVAAEGGTYDAVILGNVLCEVPEPIADTLAYVCRLLKKGGRVYFSEHVYDREHLWRAALQLLVHPWWVTVSGGCHCNRCQLEAIEACFGRENVCSWTLYAGSVPWTRRYAAEGGATWGCRGASLARFSERD